MQTVLDYLSAGAYVLTPNNRLSATLLENYFKQKANVAVEKPPCIPYRTFLTNSYKQFIYTNAYKKHPLLLSDLQCQYLWKEILLVCPKITYSEGLLTAVMDAWNNCALWQISLDNACFSYTPQTEQFQRWWQLFNQKLIALDAITEQQILPYLIEANFQFNHNQLIWVCFDSFTPQQTHLQTYLIDQGIENHYYDLPKKITPCYQFEAQHSEQELQQLMQFLKQRLALGEISIGVVVPDMKQQAQSLQRFLQRHLEPELFNISLGKTLKDYPLVAHALTWLSLGKTEISNHQAKLLLHSPYLADAQKEFQARIQLMQDTPLLKKSTINLKAWIDALSSTPLLSEVLCNISAYPTKATPQEWVTLFKTRLEKLGFPGDYGLQSENFQCFNSFMEVFNIFSQLSIFTSTLYAEEALSIIKNITAKTIFQPQTTPKPIQVLGLLEASGCQFDSLWVMGLTDQCLPQKTRLSPFIPHELQRDLNMPHSLSIRELLLARQVLDRLQNSTNLGIFSFSALQADSPNLPSPLITELSPYQPEKIDLPQKNSLLIALQETYHIPVNGEEKIAGGTALLANQAKCPFKAFATHRLHARTAPEVTEGLDARDRGKLIHQIMENIWRTLESQAQLLSLSKQQLDKQIEKAVLAALTPYALPEFIEQIELPRLQRLVHACLEWEKQRPSFTVEALEQEHTIQLGQLNFKVRVDRIDYSSGKKWIIDYKSRLPATRPWNEERPKEPQLLLYALLDETINTLLFLELKAGKMAISGFSEEKNSLAGITSPKKDSTWYNQRTYWQQQLKALADEFSDGTCMPQPLDTTICLQCDFQSLCRYTG